MPLSKKRNKERMRLSRIRKRLATPQESKAVQPKVENAMPDFVMRRRESFTAIDADGNPIYEDP